jgi:hypothetical protein
MASRRFQAVTVATLAVLALAAAGCGSSPAALSQPALNPPPTHTAVQTSQTPGWKHDPRCRLDKLMVTEVALMDDGLIPDNARNESSAHVLAVISRAERPGGSCDAVRQRMRTLLSR